MLAFSEPHVLICLRNVFDNNVEVVKNMPLYYGIPANQPSYMLLTHCENLMFGASLPRIKPAGSEQRINIYF